MSEVLEFKFKASTDSILVQVDAIEEYVDANGKTQTRVVIGGAPPPERQFELSKLAETEPQLVADLRSVLARLEPVARQTASADVADPKAVREEANRVARERQALAEEREAHDRAEAERVERIKALDDAIAAKTEAVAAKQAEVDALDTAKAAKEVPAKEPAKPEHP
jgi:hypothetical protein